MPVCPGQASRAGEQAWSRCEGRELGNPLSSLGSVPAHSMALGRESELFSFYNLALQSSSVSLLNHVLSPGLV